MVQAAIKNRRWVLVFFIVHAMEVHIFTEMLGHATGLWSNLMYQTGAHLVTPMGFTVPVARS